MEQLIRENQSGITFITGTMRSGKSAALIEILDVIGHNRCLILKPAIDTRDGACIKTRKQGYNTYSAISVDETSLQIGSLIGYALPFYKTVVIDEVNFFSKEFIELLVDDCLYNGIELIAAGLSKDFKGEWFESSALLYAEAEVIQIHSSTCYNCGDDDGTIDVMMNGDDEVILEGDSVQIEGETNDNHYETLCTLCFLNRE